MILGEVDDFARDLVPDSRVEPHQRPLFDDVELHGLIIPEEERHQLCGIATGAAFCSSTFLSAPISENDNADDDNNDNDDSGD